MHLKNVARKGDHKDKDKFTIVLSRFVGHKGKPSFAASLMLTLLSTKEEATIYEKEQKMIKRLSDETPPPCIASQAYMLPLQAAIALQQMAQTWPTNFAGIPIPLYPFSLPLLLGPTCKSIEGDLELPNRISAEH